jgi:hypothetical protein
MMHQSFAPRTHQNTLRDTRITLDAKTHVQHNVSRRAFYGI